MRAHAAPLVMRFGAFGDMVLLTVLLRHLYARFGRPVDVISSGVWTVPLLQGQTGIGQLVTLRSRRTPYWLSADQQRLVRWLRARGAGPTWFCDRDLGVELLHRGGITDGFICDSRLYPWMPGEGFADRYIRLGNESPTALAGQLPPPPQQVERVAHIEVQPSARSELQHWLQARQLCDRPYVIIHPGSRHLRRRWLRSRAGASKYWPEERWAAVVAAVRAELPGHAILLTGMSVETRMNRDIIATAGVSDVHNVANELSIRTLLPLLEGAHSLISVDTGPAHAAAALATPTVALFGTADPILFRPGGATTPAVSLTGTVDGQQNILGISAAQVMQAWMELVRQAGRGSTGSQI
ncbi:MAG: hypothetical protein JOZ12_05010 [Sinobacteraceae bacterium]|nr:hypothetical protein [Nevskiaceae bacterium]